MFEHSVGSLRGKNFSRYGRKRRFGSGAVTAARRPWFALAPAGLAAVLASQMSSIPSANAGTPIAVVSRLTDAEGKDFADDLAAAFTKAGWTVGRIENWTRQDKGVFLATLEGTAIPPEIGSVIAKAFDAAKIAYSTIVIKAEDANRIAPAFGPRVLYLLVGAKP